MTDRSKDLAALKECLDRIKNTSDVGVIDLFIQDCDNLKASVSKENREHDDELRKLSLRFATNGNARLPQQEYAAICKKQVSLKARIMENCTTNAAINRIRSEARCAKDVLYKSSVSVVQPSEIKLRIESIIAEYISFAGDTTRVSSLRAMAARVAEQLQQAIKDTTNAQ
jgi:hypothetical protein